MKAFFVLLGTSLLFSCGKSSICAFNDLVPSGQVQIDAQGSLSGENGNTVSGTVLIYRDLNTQALLLRFQSLSTSNIPALFFKAYSASSGTASQTLHGFCGHQNYTLSLSGKKTWSRIELLDPSQPSPQDIVATAQFFAP